ncbi:hypothetical protein BN14_02714 [Rhizoctonia solani AG-1 IB]|uniref:Helicase C-terminal domain-containing protein n=1 Tax=Thanatephorus cucumeris (strain AG1-IB / isolate 7/3/14) TaxID=1108050 RepID=M5BNX5_THACB|nr:hypothetical protein BN14_02714 [Rhizoctonia solani AG-1 IB]
MGCDIPDVDVVIQWCIVALSALIQRWGRAARGDGRTGLAVLFAEKSAYTYNPSIPGPKGPETKQTKNGGTVVFKKALKEPLVKGGFCPKTPGEQPSLQDDSPYEGTLAMVQTAGCLRKVWTDMFRNIPEVPVAKCCSNCSPELLTETDPPKQLSSTRAPIKKAPKKGVLHVPTLQKLFAWRSKVFDRDYPGVSWSSAAILSDKLAETLASAGPIGDEQTLKGILPGWGWWDDYGLELSRFVIPLCTPFVRLPPKPQTHKRKPPVEASIHTSVPVARLKRARTGVARTENNARGLGNEPLQGSPVAPENDHTPDQRLQDSAEPEPIHAMTQSWSLEQYTHEFDATTRPFSSFTFNTLE